mmetsp:Transcript_132023/g.228809  ORF Transcript_132023/g.228809 Transcript_132023/m.228809 type:complete len:249 (-) Transcript_132023:752-1498(-)
MSVGFGFFAIFRPPNRDTSLEPISTPDATPDAQDRYWSTDFFLFDESPTKVNPAASRICNFSASRFRIVPQLPHFSVFCIGVISKKDVLISLWQQGQVPDTSLGPTRSRYRTICRVSRKELAPTAGKPRVATVSMPCRPPRRNPRKPQDMEQMAVGTSPRAEYISRTSVTSYCRELHVSDRVLAAPLREGLRPDSLISVDIRSYASESSACLAFTLSRNDVTSERRPHCFTLSFKLSYSLSLRTGLPL